MYGQEGCLGLRGIMKHRWNTFVKKLSKVVRNSVFFLFKGIVSSIFFINDGRQKEPIPYFFVSTKHKKKRKLHPLKWFFTVVRGVKGHFLMFSLDIFLSDFLYFLVLLSNYVHWWYLTKCISRFVLGVFKHT